ncbi:MAG: hypothetical protein R3F39_25080 [Myxococcota bacterium]
MAATIPGVTMTTVSLIARSSQRPDGDDLCASGAEPEPKPRASPWAMAQAHVLAASRAFERAIADIAAPLRPLEKRGPEVARALVRTALAERLGPAAVGERLARAWQFSLSEGGSRGEVSAARCLRDEAGDAFDGLIRAVPEVDADTAQRLTRALACDQASQQAWSRRLNRALNWWRAYAEPLEPYAALRLRPERTIAARIAGTDRIALILETIAPTRQGGPFTRRLVTWVPQGPAEAMVLQAAANQGGLRRHAMRELKGCPQPSPRFTGRRVLAQTCERS